MIYYTTYGPVRGSCHHRHRTTDAANRCRSNDSQGCRSQGGYSDRSVVHVPDGTPTGDLTHERIAQLAWPGQEADDRPQYVEDAEASPR